MYSKISNTRTLSYFILIIALASFPLIIRSKSSNDPLLDEEIFPKSSSSIADINFLALGDSYTIGQSVQYEERWPVQLSSNLKAYGYEIGTLQFIARTGWTSNDLLVALFRQPADIPYDVVSLLIGVNDQFKGVDQEVYRDNFKDLLNKAIFYAGNISDHVVVVSIPDYGVTPYIQDEARREDIKNEIDLFNLINYNESINANVNYVNITEISRRALEDNSLIAQDDLHPSGKMYSEWVTSIEPIVIEILDNKYLDDTTHFPNIQNPDSSNALGLISSEVNFIFLGTLLIAFFGIVSLLFRK